MFDHVPILISDRWLISFQETFWNSNPRIKWCQGNLISAIKPQLRYLFPWKPCDISMEGLLQPLRLTTDCNPHTDTRSAVGTPFRHPTVHFPSFPYITPDFPPPWDGRQGFSKDVETRLIYFCTMLVWVPGSSYQTLDYTC